MKRFADLTEQEILALAISNEEEDSRIYRSFAEGLRKDYAASAKMFDEMADEEVRHRTMLFDLLPRKIRRIPAADPPSGREGLRAPQADLAGAAARPRRGAQIRRQHGIRDRALLSQGGGERARRVGARVADRSGRGRGQAREPRRSARREDPDAEHAQRRGRDRAAHVRAAIRAARPGRPDGRLGVDAGAAVRRGVRDPQAVGDVSGRACGLGRRRHLDGLCRSALRRRLAHRTRHAVAARQRSAA